VGSVVAAAVGGGVVVGGVVSTAAVRRAGPPPMSVEPRRVAVLRALPGLGDLLCAVPALRAMRAAWPGARITLLGLPQARWFVQRYGHLVDDLLPVEGVGGLPEVRPDRHRAQRFLDAARERSFDLAIQAHGSGTVTNRLLTLLGARHLVTAHVRGHWTPPGTSIVYPDAPEVVRLLRLVAAAGCPPRGLDIDLPVSASEERATRRLLDGAGLRPGEYACLHPGASRPSRRWPAEHFAAVGDRLVGRGLPVVVTGSAGERDVARAVLRRMRRPDAAHGLSGRTGVGTLAALYRQARLVVTNDTGASHVAAAVRAPSVVVSASPDPWRWAPLDGARHTFLTAPARSGSPWPGRDEVTAAIDVQLDRVGRGDEVMEAR
jgi:ADP-heptose:LPS heptosyltransferase